MHRYSMGLMGVFLWCLTSLSASKAFGGDWFVLSNAGRLADSVLTRVVYSSDYTDSTFVALGVGRKLLENKGYLRLEVEGQLARHSGQRTFPCKCEVCSNPGYAWAPGQSYEKSVDVSRLIFYEMTGALVIRWLKFPWEKYIDIDFAAGEGLSYTTEVPPIEVDAHKINHGDDQNMSHLLNYLMFEFTFALPRLSSWHLIYRVHHRSGDFGLINGVSDGSNFICLGIRYDF